MIFGFIVYSECFLYSFLIDSFTVSFHDLCWYPQCLRRTGWSRLEQAGAGVVMVGGWSVVWPRSAQWETGDKRAREEWTPWDDHSNGDHSAPVSRLCLRSHLVDKLCIHFTFIVHCPKLRVIYQLGLIKTVSNSFIKTILFVKSFNWKTPFDGSMWVWTWFFCDNNFIRKWLDDDGVKNLNLRKLASQT